MSCFPGRSRITPFRVWFVFTAVVLSVSLITGYRASRAAQAPQYLFTKTRVVVEVEFVPAGAEDAAVEAAFREAGEAPSTVPEFHPLFVLGLLDAALPAEMLCLLACVIWSRRRRARITASQPATAARAAAKYEP